MNIFDLFNLHGRDIVPSFLKYCLKKKNFVLGLMTFIAVVMFSGCSNTQPITHSELTMDTVCTVTIYDGQDEILLDQAFSIIDALDAELDAFSEDSIIGEINAQAGISPVVVDSEIFGLIETALKYSEISGGGFDISAGPLIELWAIGEPETKEAPSEAAIEKAKSLVNYKKIVLDPEASSVFLTEQGMKLNLGAVAKGFAAAKVRDYLVSAGVTRALINLGGSVTTIGGKTAQKDFSVGVTDPDNPESGNIGILSLRDTSAVTSGDYQRYFTDSSGRRWHHILDANTGKPADNGIRQVTVICEDTLRADALSTTLFIMGTDQAKDYLETHDDIEGVIVFSDGSIYVSDGAKMTK